MLFSNGCFGEQELRPGAEGDVDVALRGHQFKRKVE